MATAKTTTKRRKLPDTIYLDLPKRELLDKLVAKTRIARAVLLREAVDDLLVKYRLLKAPKVDKP